MTKRRSKHSRRRPRDPTRPQAKRAFGNAKRGEVSRLKRGDLVLPILASLMLAAATLPASGAVLGSYYSPRVAVFYPLALILLIAWLVSWLRLPEPVHLDLLDLALISFIIWELIAAAAAPVASLGWFGAYNRIGGAFFWLALGLLLLISRRVFSERSTMEILVWVVCTVVFLAVGVALLQGIGVHSPWPYRKIWYGRVIGTTGNPLNLAGLCLLGIWLGFLARSGALGRRVRVAAATGAVLSVVGLILAVSRAAYLGVAIAALFLVATALVARWWRVVVALVVASTVLAGVALIYQTSSSSSDAYGHRLSLNPATLINSAAGDTRVVFWRIGVRGIEARPLLGYGPGGYVVAYRQFVEAKRMQKRPLSGVTDPHSLPLLIADGSGLTGFGIALICLAFAAHLAWSRVKRDLRGEHQRPASPALGSAACAVALLAFLAVSPSDPSTLVPLALMTALAAGPPRANDRFGVTLPNHPAFRWAQIVLIAAASVALMVSLYLGVQLIRADHAAKQGVVVGESGAAEHSARLMPSIPTFNLIAWNAILRSAIADGNDKQVAAMGERYLTQGLKDDPSDPMLRVALVRYEFMLGDTTRAATDIKAGLRYNPTNPLLQSLLGYLAQAIARDSSQRGGAQQLVDELSALPSKTADGWYWLGVAQATLGQNQAAGLSIAQARRLAPTLGPASYRRRIRGEF